jgi:hypothetical protein
LSAQAWIRARLLLACAGGANAAKAVNTAIEERITIMRFTRLLLDRLQWVERTISAV